MDRTVVILNSFEEAEKADIFEQIRLTPEERQQIAKSLKIRVYGDHPPDIRDSVNCK